MIRVSVGLIAALAALTLTSSAAPARTVRVMNYAGECNTAAGCASTKPRTWLPSRIPRGGYGLVLKRIRWRAWGKAVAYGRASYTACAGQAPCQRFSGRLRFKVYKPGRRIESPHQRVYRCMTITSGGPVELRHAATIISSDSDAPLDLCRD